MTREARVFRSALLVSLALHGVLLALFMTLPGGGPEEPVRIYTVRIMEVPARPQAQALELSTQPISALKLEGPTLSPDAPPTAEPETPDVPDLERFAAPAPPPGAKPEATAPSLPAAAPREAPTPPGPQPPAATSPPAALPALPALPGAKPPSGKPPPAGPPRPPAATAEEPPAPPLPDEPQRQTAMEQLRSKVNKLNLEVEAAPPAGPSRPVPATERNVLSFRVYSNRVREAVKEQYTFPGGFPAGLRTRVKLVLNRDGTVRSAEVMDSSGNERFDRLVCLAAFSKARIPAVPRTVDPDSDSLTLFFTCSP